MSEIIDRFRPAGSGFVRIDTKIICRQQQGYLLVQVVYLPSLRHAMNFWTTLVHKTTGTKSKISFWLVFAELYGPISAWDKDSGEIYPVKTDLKLAMIMLVLYDQKKPISSREGMKRCAETSTIFDDWVRQSEEDYKAMLIYLSNNHFSKIGELTEKNALAMHATTQTASPLFLI